MNQNELTVGERFMRALKGESVDRLPVIEMSMWWDTTVGNWQAQGLGWQKKYSGRFDCIMELHDFFGLDMLGQMWVKPYTDKTPRNRLGKVSTMEEYEKALRPTMYPEPAFDPDYIKRVKKLKSEGRITAELIMGGAFWEPREVMGIEPHLYSFYDDPELYHTMVADLTAWHKKVIQYAMKVVDFDFILWAEDMSYNIGPMLSKQCFDEFIAPYYNELVPLCNQAGLFPMLDSDGDIMTALGWFSEVGIKGAEPLEVQAGFDVNKAQLAYPDMSFVGNFDKMAMPKGKAAMEKEFERLAPAAKRGKFILSVDHQTPPGVTLENYQAYLVLYKRWAVEAIK
ncbi:MAG: hypothetical protein FWE62_02315 [Firmicutes bacterium]|nr:hypothetical protein [Bacillota bacterium]